ncbi:MAG: hypothetical protein RL071_2302 [Pseudomonadota bacterium]
MIRRLSSAAPSAWARALAFALLLPACAGDAEVDDGDDKPVDRDGDGVPLPLDCDDSDAAVSPEADELCDGIDNDCDLEVDEGVTPDGLMFYADADDDGFGSPNYTLVRCAQPEGYVASGGDCDDLDSGIRPDATESCDGADEDCDGEIDEAGSAGEDLWFRDADSDGFGSGEDTAQACEQPEGYVSTSSDCDDEDAAVNPEGLESWYDGVDSDCDGRDDFDADLDGYRSDAFGGDDCEDDNDAIRPGVTEVCDGDDNDCDGLTDEDGASGASRFYGDADRDGYGVISVTRDACTAPAGYAPRSGDCDDDNNLIRPGLPERWYDGVDTDCDSESDFDSDRDGIDSLDYGGLDCDDEDALVGAAGTWWPDPDGDTYGDREVAPVIDCGDGLPDGFVDNGGDCDEADAGVNAGATEIAADWRDQDCDGADRLDVDRDGWVDAAYGGDDCDDTDGRIHPYAWEVLADGVDNDCDGGADGSDPDAGAVLSLSLLDDDYAELPLSGTAISWCGADWSSVWVSSNGRITFTDGSIRTSPNPTDHAAELSLAGLWADLDPSRAGTIQWVELDDAVQVRFDSVPLFSSTSTRHSFTMTLTADGQALVSYDRLDSGVFLAGWSCGAGEVTRLDLSAEMESYPDAGGGLGRGTEDGVYEQFTAGSPADLSGLTLTYCGPRGADADNDGWSDLCGDFDDTEVTLYPL